MIRNSYLDIAENDLEYLESVLKTGSRFYNQLAVQCQQVAEKYLKKLASFFDFPIAFYQPNRYNEAMGTRGLPARRARPAMRAGFLEVAN